MVGNFTVDVTGTGQAGLRWFELRKSGAGDWSRMTTAPGSSEITVAGATPTTYTITVAWPEIGQAEPANYVLTVQL